MLLCLPCEQIMLIRVNQGKGFMQDLCPECRAKVRKAFKVARTG